MKSIAILTNLTFITGGDESYHSSIKTSQDLFTLHEIVLLSSCLIAISSVCDIFKKRKKLLCRSNCGQRKEEGEDVRETIMQPVGLAKKNGKRC